MSHEKARRSLPTRTKTDLDLMAAKDQKEMIKNQVIIREALTQGGAQKNGEEIRVVRLKKTKGLTVIVTGGRRPLLDRI